MNIFLIGRRARLINRVRVVVSVVIRQGLGYFLDQIFHEPSMRFLRWRGMSVSPRVDKLSPPERLARTLKQLGPTYIKIGQFFSTRGDILPEEYLHELEKLQNKVDPFPFKEVKEIIKTQLHADISEVFSSFDPEPFNSASIAQVHRACLMDGTRCVVKVQRPGIDRLVRQDIAVIYEIARIAEKRIPELKQFRILQFVEDFGENVQRQLDFLYEAGMMEKMREAFASADIIVPKVFWDQSSKKILVMEEFEGIRITEVMEEREVLVRRLVKSVFQVLFETGFFHGDLHPGNLLYSQKKGLALVDFGLSGYLSLSRRRNLGAIVAGALKGDIEGCISPVRRLFDIPRETRFLEEEITLFVNRYSCIPITKVHLGGLVQELMRIGRKINVRVDPELALFGKTLFHLESLCSILAPGMNILEVSREYWEHLVKKGLHQSMWISEAKSILRSYWDFFESFPGNWEEFVRVSEQRLLREEELLETVSRYSKGLETTGIRIIAGIVLLPILVVAVIFGYHTYPPRLFLLLIFFLTVGLFAGFTLVSRR
ncbi:MAG: AarF/UbiB family protein [Candidatus Ratteibacteria bacterium]|jgi:ubiquinone biosynthesis protein